MAHPEKHEVEVSQSGTLYTLDYELESLMVDLLSLRESENVWKRVKKNGYGGLKNGYKGLFEISDGYHISQWQLPESYSGKTMDEIKKAIGEKQIDEAMSKMFKNTEVQERMFWD